MFSTTIGAGDVYVHRMAGGGGWGDPLERDPERVADDVIDGKVTREPRSSTTASRRRDGEVDDERTREERDGRR